MHTFIIFFSCFEGWETLVQKPKLAECAIVATQDRDHVEPAIKLAELGYVMNLSFATNLYGLVVWLF